MKPEIETMKTLFISFAAAIEKVANELLEPSTDVRISFPAELMEYWLQFVEMVMETQPASLLGKNEKKYIDMLYERYLREYQKMKPLIPKYSVPLSFDEWVNIRLMAFE